MTTVYCTKGHDNLDSNRFCQICGEKLTPPVPETNLLAGNVLEDRYRIVQQIGQGGFGRTYLCENLTRFNEPCVLKEFAPQVQGTYALEKAKKLFEREASVLHNLTHPQIPRFRELFEMKTGSQGLFLVQDYVAGQTYRYLLAARQQQNRLFTEAEVRQLLVDTLPVLQYIHSLGVIHRDIAPDNLMLRSSDNLPVLIDFGGVKQIAVNAEIHATGNTEVPTCLGKVGYAPHEQMQRGTVSANSDLYALAATSLVLLTGKEPTDLIDPQSLTWNWRSAVELNPKLGEIFDRMLQPNPANRFQSAPEVLRALQQADVTPIPVVQQKQGSSHLGTVVVAPAPKQVAAVGASSGSAAVAGNDSSFMQILGRSWIGILGVGGVGAMAWAGSSLINKPNNSIAPLPTPTPIVTPSASSSSTPSPFPTPSEEPSPSSTPSNSSEKSGVPNNVNNSGSKPNQDKPASERESSIKPDKPVKRPAKSTKTDNGNDFEVDRPSSNPPQRTPKASIDEDTPSRPPRVEIIEPKPRAPKPEPEEPKPRPRQPRVEIIEPKPRAPKPEPEEPKPRSREPRVENIEPKPRKRPEAANRPANPPPAREPRKQPPKQSDSGGDDEKGPLF
jgi:serine/threonine protein kinase